MYQITLCTKVWTYRKKSPHILPSLNFERETSMVCTNILRLCILSCIYISHVLQHLCYKVGKSHVTSNPNNESLDYYLSSIMFTKNVTSMSIHKDLKLQKGKRLIALSKIGRRGLFPSIH